MWCTCARYCRGGRKVARSTWYSHTAHRLLLPEFHPLHEQSGAQSHLNGTQDPQFDLGSDSSDTDSQHPAKRLRLDDSPDSHEHDRSLPVSEEGGPERDPELPEDVDPFEGSGSPADTTGGAGQIGNGNETMEDLQDHHERSHSGSDAEEEVIDAELNSDAGDDVSDETLEAERVPPPPSPEPSEPGLPPPMCDVSPMLELNDDYTARCEGLPVEPDFVSPVAELQKSLEFIRTLEHASLDNSGLRPDAISRLRNPQQYSLAIQDPDELFSLKQFLATQNASQQTYNDIRDNHNERHPDELMLSYSQVKNKLAEWSGVEAIVHDMCPNSCLAYTGPFADLDECPTCGDGRYESVRSHSRVKKAVRKFYTLPIGPQLQALWRTPQGARNMQHRWRETQKILTAAENTDAISISAYNDIYHGREYLGAVMRGDIAPDDIVLMFSMDGAQLYRDKQSDCWIYIWVILDLPPELRYKKKHVLPGGFIPGPNNPKNMESFLFPGFHHLAALQKEGLRLWNASENRLFVSHLFFLFKSTDGPGSVHLSCLVGHHGAFPCRLFCGIKGRHKPGVPHYYPALLKPHDYDVVGCNHPDIDIQTIKYRSVCDYDAKLRYLLLARNPNEYKQRRRATGITKASLLAGIPGKHRLPLVSLLAGDSMHVPTLNLGDLLPPLWCGLFQCAPSDSVAIWDWAVLKGDIWKAHGEAVAMSRPYIPSSFDRPPRNIAEKINSGYKAKEWQGYFLGLAPALLYGILPMPYWQNFCRLVFAVRILHQRTIPQDQLICAQSSLNRFHLEYELLYVQRRADRLHFVCPCLHALLHLGFEVPRLGPPTLYSTWTMERTIGNLGEEIKQPSKPYANLSERGLLRSQVNAIKAMIPSLDRSEPVLPRGSEDLGNGYILLRALERTARRHDGARGLAILSYMRNTAAQLGYPMLPNTAIKVARWGRLRLPTGQIARSSWSEDKRPISSLRRSRCVKIILENQVEFAEVHFYFRLKIGEAKHTLALVQLYSQPDPILYRDSCYTVFSVTQLDEDNGIRVIDVKCIRSVVSMQPHDHRLEDGAERFFVWEQVGLEVSLLGDAQESLEEE